MIEPSIETTSENNVVTLVAGEKRISFATMSDLSQFADTLGNLLSNWRSGERFASLREMKCQIAAAITEELREELRVKVSEKAAASFPDNVVVGGQWEIDISESGRGPDIAIITARKMVKDLIADLATAIEAGRDAAFATL